MKRVSSIIVVVTLLLCAAYTPANAAAVKDWTVAVFLNADNNLDPFGVEDQREMAKVGSSDFLNIVSLIDREHGPAQINYIEKNNIKKVKDMGEMDMGDYRQFVAFAKFVKENYPAKHYCFTIWNHGSGWKNKGTSAIYRGISYDDSSNNHITNAQLGTAVAEVSKILGQKIDILNFDACLMQMVEVAHAVKDNVVYMVASEELEPGKGAPYDDILRGVKAGMNAQAYALNWVNAFAKSYNGGSQGFDESTQSALDMSKFGPVVDSVNGLAKALMTGKNTMIVKAALAKVQKFGDPGNVDLVAELLNFG
ncbi:MAG TPA: clostripain-related cysteine peptidase, partial [Candidatus Rifleibacterium sp.]|nr:clostripain-related cysteine peptidase [Candidatus Rifleibacterium sp.]